MRKMLGVGAAALALTVAGLGAGAHAAPASSRQVEKLEIGEFTLSQAAKDQLWQKFADRTLARYPQGSWAPLKMELDDSDLALMGLPPKKVLLSQRYDKPTTFDEKGRPKEAASDPALVTFAGTGFFGIRPGAWVLLLSDGGIGWCSLAHVYGSPGSYDISTAGHCGKTGDIATAIGVVGNRTPVLLDFGKFSKSTGDGGIGKDWALIDIYPQYQHLVTPTMAFWGGPFGMYTKTGDVAAVNWPRRGLPTVSVNPDPFLVQQVVHYGHGTVIGTGGTPRTGTSIVWRPSYFTFFGALAPGDSGSGTNTLTGDTVGAQREAAGINTHIYVDLSMRTGFGIMAGTRATLVTATLANGQLVPYPVPAPGLP